LKNGYITVDQLTAAFNYYIVDYDLSKGVHNPAMAVALLEDALDRVPATAACLSWILTLTASWEWLMP